MAQNLTENPAIAPTNEQGLPIRFNIDFKTKKYQLFEIPDAALLESIMNGSETPLIKNFTIGKSMAALCTSTETFKIKKAENTNSFFIMNVQDKGAEILTQTSL
jgi:hypothetical protein